MLRIKCIVIAVVAMAIVLAQPATSSAGFRVTVQYGAAYGTSAAGTLNDLDITTLSAPYYTTPSGNDKTFEPGAITATSGGGTYTISLIAGYANTPGTASDSYLQLTSLSVTHSGTVNQDLLTISITATDFTLPTSPVSLQSKLSGNFANTSATGSAKYESWFDGTNANYGTATAIVSPVFTLFPSGSAGGTYFADGTFANSFSLTSQVTIKGLSNGRNNAFVSGGISTDVVTATPAPAGLILVATAVPFLGLLRRRFRNSVVAAA